MIRFLQCAVLSLLVVFASGCTQRFDSSYGPSTGLPGRNSINGFGALRSSYEKAGYKTRDIRRLTDRTKRSDVIVWTPQVMKSTQLKVTRWFERWLTQGGRTLIYIVPDSGSEANYWVQAGQSAPPKQRMEYRRRAARQLNERLQWTINRRESFTNGWFIVRPKPEIFRRGELSTQNWDLASQTTDTDATPTILTEYVIEPYQPPSSATANAPAAKINFNNGPTGPAAPFTPYTEEEVTDTEVDFDSLVKTESGETIVAKVTCDAWNDSQIIVVAGGSLLTNFAFTQDITTELAAQLIEAGQSLNQNTTATIGEPNDQTAGFLLSSYNPIPVSESKPGVPQASGMELLTVWPISLVTIHAALLGFVVCMMLLPIFGRARKVDRGSSSRFGDHLDAVASLMNSARGEKYARARISEYMRRMKGETQGEWVLPETPKANPQTTPAKTPLKQTPQTNQATTNETSTNELDSENERPNQSSDSTDRVSQDPMF